MTPGPSEELGITARSLIDSLKSSPMMLFLIVFNCLFMVLVFYLSMHARTSNEKLILTLLEHQQEVAKLLYNCTPGTQPTL